jgi:hypothetical protein
MLDRKDWISILVIALLVLAVFWRAMLGGVFYLGDIVQLHYPLRSVYAAELARSALPLWTPHLFAGYPLLAEGQLGALYPPNLILHWLLPVPVALNVFILGHFVWAAIGAYAFARRLRMHRTAAGCVALVYGLGGFLVAHLDQVNIVACAAWQPWLFLLVDRLLVGATPSHPARDAALLALAVGMEFLAGHPPMALLSLLAVVAYGLYLFLALRQQRQLLLLLAMGLLAGVALAAAQLLPTVELTQWSVRSGELDPELFTSFSMHPPYLVSLLSPFVLGNPYPETSVEWVGYVGLLPLLLAVIAPFLAQSRPDVALRSVKPARFFAVLAVIALLLSLGRYNPVHMAWLRLPALGLFRVPGLYLYLFAFSAAVLAGLSLDTLLTRGRKYLDAAEGGPGWLAVVIVALVAVVIAARIPLVDTWLAIWRWLPVALGLLALAWIVWAWLSKGSSHAMLGAVALVLVLADLVAFGAVYNLTCNQTMPLQEFTAQPRSLPFLQSQTGVYRIYTREKIVPRLSVLRESYSPNLSLIYGLSTGNGLGPLVPARYAQYTAEMTSPMLDLLGVKYYLIPQVLPVDEASEAYDLDDPFMFNPMDKVVPTPIVMAAAVEIEWYLSQSAEWQNGQPVAVLTFLTEESVDLTDIALTVGSHVAEWAYDRSDVRETVLHNQAVIARTFPARSGFPAEDHPGYVYRAVMGLPYPVLIHGLQLKSSVPPARIHIERVTLIDEQGQRYLLSHLEGKGDHILAYRSEDVAIFENNDVLPRVFLAYQARAVLDDTEALSILRSADFPRREVLLAAEQIASTELPTAGTERVELTVYDSRQVVVKVQAPADGYLVLTDAWYPGWHVRVDGQEAPLLRADVIFRAVHLQAGEHTVEFTYDPASFRTGLRISAAALAWVLGLWLWGRKKGGAVASW